jgi:hypothetical protein
MNISGDKNSITKDKHLLPITKEHLEHENKDTKTHEDTDEWIYIPKSKEKRKQASKITPKDHNYNE